MRRSYLEFNSICLCFMAVFMVGNIWMLRQVRAEKPAVEATEIEPIRVPETPDHPITQSSASAEAAADKPNHTTPTIDQPSEQENEPVEKELPKQFTLNVPFTSQAPEKNWEQPWQDACEEAAILMLDGYFKNYKVSPLFAKDEIIKMVAWEEAKGWERSIEIEKIKTIFENYLGLAPKKKIRIVEDPTVEQLKRFIADGKPVYVVADGKVLPNPHFRSGGPAYHALVIKGYNETEFITNDPGTQFGENFAYTYNDLMKSIRDWNNGNVKEGRRVILVIE